MWLTDAQIYHYRARAYAPQIGRFLQTDPMGYGAGANLYAYVGGDPINSWDPTGQTCELVSTGRILRYQCKLNSIAGLSRSEISTATRAYTSAVNALMAHPDRTILLASTPFGPTHEISARTAANILITTNVRGEAGLGGDRGLATGGNSSPFGPKSITIYSEAITRNYYNGDDLMVTFIHESFHLDAGEERYIGAGHNNNYNLAARKLLDTSWRSSITDQFSEWIR